MSRQHTRPLLVTLGESNSATGLQQVDLADAGGGSFPEDFIQELLFRNPALLPIDELEPAYAPAFPVCRELPTDAGPVDLLFASPSGQLTVVECKLWRNPEARREVVGQVLDYASQISRWSYDDLVRRVSRALGGDGDPVFSAVSQSGEAPAHHEFADSVARNLRRGRLLLIIAGDGIRETVEQLTDHLQKHIHLGFSLALVELSLYRLPEPLSTRLLVAPRVIARTVQIERAVIRLEDGVVSITPTFTSAEDGNRAGRRTSLTEEAFFEKMNVADGTKVALKEFLAACEGIGLETVVTASLHIKLAGRYNFGSFMQDGTFRNFGIVEKLKQVGHRDLGERYLRELAALIPGAVVEKAPSDFRWTVRTAGGYLSAAAVLEVAQPWLALMERTKDAIEASSAGDDARHSFPS